MSGLTEKLRRVYVPMTETGFLYPLLSSERKAWLQYYSKSQAIDRRTAIYQPGNHVRDLGKDGKRWLDCLCSRGRKEKALFYHGAWKPDFRVGNPAD